MSYNEKLIIVKNAILPLCKKRSIVMLHITMWVILFFQVLSRNLERQSMQLYLADVLFLLHFSLQIHVLD